jgi:hypothetical protein
VKSRRDSYRSWRKLECGRIGEEWILEEEGEKRGGAEDSENIRKNRES